MYGGLIKMISRGKNYVYLTAFRKTDAKAVTVRAIRGRNKDVYVSKDLTLPALREFITRLKHLEKELEQAV
jgi:hypothetical protein